MKKTDLQPIIEAVRQAARLCRTVQNHYLESAEKAGHEPVTIADYGSQAILCRAISLTFPEDKIVAEEQAAQFVEAVEAPKRAQIAELVSMVLGETITEADMRHWMDYGRGHDSAMRTWVIDPIDGTKGFLARRNYTIAVGLMENHYPIAGVMGCPGYEDGRIFYALDGKTYMESLENIAEARPLRVTEAVTAIRVVESVETKHADHDLMAQVYQAAGFPHPEAKRVDGQDKYALVACGDAELYLRISPNTNYQAKVWDHAAGVAVIEGAGGKVTDQNGRLLDFSLGRTLAESRAIVVSNGKIHHQVLAALREVNLD